MTKTEYNKFGYDRDGRNRFGYNINGLDIHGFLQTGIHVVTKTKYDPYGFDQVGYNKNGVYRYNLMLLIQKDSKLSSLEAEKQSIAAAEKLIDTQNQSHDRLK